MSFLFGLSEGWLSAALFADEMKSRGMIRAGGNLGLCKASDESEKETGRRKERGKNERRIESSVVHGPKTHQRFSRGFDSRFSSSFVSGDYCVRFISD
jgi:hypothetical protein